MYGEDNKNNRIKLGVLRTNKTIFFGSEASKERNKEIYGVEYYQQTEEFKENKRQRDFNRIKLKFDNKNITIVSQDKDTKDFTIHCNLCNSTSILTKQQFRYRRKSKLFCPICNPNKTFVNFNYQEHEIYNYLKSVYRKEIRYRDRTVIKPKELDFYLPDLNFAIEYNGSYWHADPRLYKENDVVHGKRAVDIWQRDNLKKQLCEQNNIKLFVINEYDWLNDKNKVICNLLKTINKINGDEIYMNETNFADDFLTFLASTKEADLEKLFSFALDSLMFSIKASQYHWSCESGFQHEHFEKIYNIIRDFADKLVETVLSMGVKFKANNKTYVINDELFDISSAILKIEAFRDSLIDLKSQYSTKISLENLFGDTIEELDKEIGLLKNFK